MTIQAATNSNQAIDTTAKLNLSEIIEDIFLVLTNKEKNVIIKRFSLDNQPKQTLEKIGQEFSVTRERIRQIEKIALTKLRRTVSNTRLSVINKLAKELIEKNGGVLIEERIISEILNLIHAKEKVDSHIIRLSLHINSDLIKTDKSQSSKPFWRINTVNNQEIKDIIKAGINLLNKKGDVIVQNELAIKVQKHLSTKYTDIPAFRVFSVLDTENRIKKTENGYGLMSWRHINPQSIRDKAYIVLKKGNKPLHFVEIANRITEEEFDKKVVTTQAVHNELIRYDQFVLVGRGLYALKEWGYTQGTVADVIGKVLAKKSPMSKQEIITEVLKQRQVKKGTISLNLQKNPEFVRVGRAVYSLKSKLN